MTFFLATNIIHINEWYADDGFGNPIIISNQAYENRLAPGWGAYHAMVEYH